MINIDKNLFLNQAENVTAVTSGIEGSGKTWLASTLAHALNLLKQNVLLFDADNGVSNITYQLDLHREYYLDDAIMNKCCLNQTIGAFKRHFESIAARAGCEMIDNISLGRLQLLGEDFSILAKSYDQVILDVLPSEKILQNFLPSYKNLVLVCNNEPANLVETYKILQAAVRENRFGNLQIVVNYANSKEEGIRTYNTLRHACEQYIQITPKLLGIVRSDSLVRDTIRNHSLLLSRYPNSEAAQDIMELAKNLIRKEI